MARLSRIGRARTAIAQGLATLIIVICPRDHPQAAGVQRFSARLLEELRLDARLRP